MSDYSIRDDRTLRGWPLPHADNYLQDDVLRLRDAITSIDSAVTQLDSAKTDSAALAEALASKADIASLDLKADVSALTEHVGSSSPHGFKSSAIELLNTLDPQSEDVGKVLGISLSGGKRTLYPVRRQGRMAVKPVGSFSHTYGVSVPVLSNATSFESLDDRICLISTANFSIFFDSESLKSYSFASGYKVLSACKWDDNLYFAYVRKTNSGSSTTYNYYLYRSSDGINWTLDTNNPADANLSSCLLLRVGDKLIIASSSKVISRTQSSDGSWSEFSATSISNGPGNPLYLIAIKKDNTYYSVYSNYIYSSTNGITWSKRQIPGLGSIKSFYHTGSFWFAADSSKIATSDDGINWTIADNLAWPSGYSLNSIIAVGDEIIAVSNIDSSKSQRFQRSADRGETWQIIPPINSFGTSSLPAVMLMDSLNNVVCAAPSVVSFLQADGTWKNYAFGDQNEVNFVGYENGILFTRNNAIKVITETTSSIDVDGTYKLDVPDNVLGLKVNKLIGGGGGSEKNGARLTGAYIPLNPSDTLTVIVGGGYNRLTTASAGATSVYVNGELLLRAPGGNETSSSSIYADDVLITPVYDKSYTPYITDWTSSRGSATNACSFTDSAGMRKTLLSFNNNNFIDITISKNDGACGLADICFIVEEV